MTSWNIAGCDFSTDRPDLEKLWALGYRWLGLYLPTGTAKGASPTYVDGARKIGYRIMPLFETTSNRALAGSAAGVVDARRALDLAASWELPTTVPIVGVTIDFNASPAQMRGAVGAYAAAWHDKLGGRAWGYGGYEQIKYLFDHRLIGGALQTYAWSSGRWDVRAQFRQEHNAAPVAGGSIDRGHGTAAGFNQLWLPEGEDMQAVDVWKGTDVDVIDAGPYATADNPTWAPKGTLEFLVRENKKRADENAEILSILRAG